VCQGKHYFSEEIMYSVIRNLNKSDAEVPDIQLSSRETEVLTHIAYKVTRNREKRLITLLFINNLRLVDL